MSDPVEDTPSLDDDDGDGAGWLATFADLMSLLMCFFVLLLSFSEIEASKYKQVAGSMKNAFGVQREIQTKEIPKGTSIIAREFSPGKPQPTVTPMIQQATTAQFDPNLEISKNDVDNDDDESSPASVEAPPITEDVIEIAKMLAEALREEIEEGQIEVEALPDRVAIRVKERGSFTSGSATIKQPFEPVLERVAKVLGALQGPIVVSGHTDDIPIATARFPSNWELSAARASAFVHFMTKTNHVDAHRMEIRAHGEMRPLAVNNSRESRARNRRVEIALVIPTRQLPDVRRSMGDLIAARAVSAEPKGEE